MTFKTGICKLSCFIIPVLFFFSLSGYSQAPDNVRQDLREIEKNLDEKRYEDALLRLREMFDSSALIPNEAAFLYGKTMLGLKKYLSAKEAFRKYLQVAGPTGKYFGEAKSLADSASKFECLHCHNTGIQEITETCARCQGKGKLPLSCSLCNGAGKTVCELCNGKGVITSSGNFGGVFHTCSSCHGKGYADCSKCHGSKNEYTFCNLCSGTGKIKTTKPCPH
jgi:DnaJ-class molecular chaperone